ncbi:MAG: PqqD family protein [Syntrophaceae bacterium]|nr:PqqD family protein [Syntrophaceae bacterium]
MEVKVTTNTICVPSEDVVAREIEGDMIIVPLVAGIGDADDDLYTLNETGKAIWKKLDGQRSLEQVSMELADEFSSPPKEIKADVLGFAAEMVQRRILTVKQ